MPLAHKFLILLIISLLIISLASCSTDESNDDQSDSEDDDIGDDDEEGEEPYENRFGCSSLNNEWTVGQIVAKDEAHEGYTLFAPISSTTTYLVNMCGQVVNQWTSDYKPGHSVYLLEDGTLLRSAQLGPKVNDTFKEGGAGGLVELFDWDNNLIWEYEYSGDKYLQHHDAKMLPNGNVLLLAWELKSQQEALGAGVEPHLVSEEGLWMEHIVEVEPAGPDSGQIVWEWHLWDHLVQNLYPEKDNFGVVHEHPELVNINADRPAIADWTHANSIDYNPALDQILISVRYLNEIWIIDHSTTTDEAAGHLGGDSGKGGDLLYRWGNPNIYMPDQGYEQKLFLQHDAHWIEPGNPGQGNILVFNNGDMFMDRGYSSVDEIVPPVNSDGSYMSAQSGSFGPDAPVWTYQADNPLEFFSRVVSGAQRQPNGNTLICAGETGTIFEVTEAGQIVWMYVNPDIGERIVTQGEQPSTPTGSAGEGNILFRAYRYNLDYPGLAGKNINPGDFIEKAG